MEFAMPTMYARVLNLVAHATMVKFAPQAM
jgi:hypothetical protein